MQPDSSDLVATVKLVPHKPWFFMTLKSLNLAVLSWIPNSNSCILHTDIVRPNVQKNLFTQPWKSYNCFAKLLYQPFTENFMTNFQATKEQVDLLHFSQTLYVLLVPQIWGILLYQWTATSMNCRSCTHRVKNLIVGSAKIMHTSGTISCNSAVYY